MKRKLALITALSAALALSGCTKDGDPQDIDTPPVEATESADNEAGSPPAATPTPTPEPLSPEEIALQEKDREYADWIHTVLLMAPHSEVDGLFVHQDPESLDYLRSIVGTRIELTDQDVNSNLFYRYIAFTLDVSSFSELSEKLGSTRATGKIFFTFTKDFDDMGRRIRLEIEGTDIILK